MLIKNLNRTKISYLKTPLSKYTFEAPRIKRWVEKEVEGKVLNLFAGKVKLDCEEVRVDLNPKWNPDYVMNALQFVRNIWDLGVNPVTFGTFLLDPPYSFRKSMEKYNGFVSSPFNQLKDAISQVIKPGGVVITFGYQSVSMGAKRRFVQDHILLMSHGGAIHDTIAVKERKRE